MGQINYTGKPWRNPEDSLLRDKMDPNFIPPPFKEGPSDSPLVRPVKVDKEHEAITRALQSNCIFDTLEFVKMPILLGLSYGAMEAATHAKPGPQDQLNTLVTSRWTTATKSVLREIKYLKTPILITGGFSAFYSLVSCSLAQWRGRDDIVGSCMSGSLTGLAIGYYLRSPNKMFVLGVYGAVIAGLAKQYISDPRSSRPFNLTYYEKVAARRDMMSPKFKEAASDGYLHEWLQPKLKRLEIEIPESWPDVQAEK